MITDLKINEEAKERYYKEGYWTSDTIVDAFAHSVELHPEKTFVKDDQGAAFSYAECDEASDRMAAWLMERGIERGDVVTIQLPTWAEYVPVFLGVLKAGGVIHPIARNYSESDLAFVMNKVGSKGFVCPTHFHSTDHEEQAVALLDEVPTLDRSRIMVLRKQGPESRQGFESFEDLLSQEGAGKPELPECSSEDVACILSTSGTTGKPKQALLTHNNILFAERSFLANGIGRDEDDIMFMGSPLNHSTGLFHGVISPMLLGSTTILMQDFDGDAAVELINREKVTWSMGATPFIYDMLHSIIEHGTSMPTLELFICGGAPVPRELVKCAFAHNIKMCECYGSTESSPHIYVPPEHCLDWDGKWSGVALPGIEVRIVDEARNDVAPGVMGEEASRGPNVFAGYLNDQEHTDEVLDDDGWFYSGDLAVMDEEGRIHICGRKKEVVIRGGEKISVREVDDVVDDWPCIVDHAVVGAPDARMGERICLFAVPAPGVKGEDLDLEELKEHLRAKGVSKRLWPERIEAIDHIPRTATGKVQRFLLSQELDRRMGRQTPKA